MPKKKKNDAALLDDFDGVDIPADQTLDSGEMVLRLLEEEFGVSRRTVETGRVLVRKSTKERVVEIAEELERLEYEIERVTVDAFVESRPPVTETDDVIVIPVVEEVLVVERRLRVREEIRIRKSRHIDHFRDEVRLRVQEADVRRLSPRPSVPGD